MTFSKNLNDKKDINKIFKFILRINKNIFIVLLLMRQSQCPWIEALEYFYDMIITDLVIFIYDRII